MIATRFPLGKLFCTANVHESMKASPAFSFHVSTSMLRHTTGDWGEIDPRDMGLNEEALINGSRIFSVYKRSDMPTIWIITEADRSVTTVLFPDDY